MGKRKNIGLDERQAHRTLWQSVLLQAFRDAFKQIGKRRKYLADEMEVIRARQWLVKDSDSLYDVCSAADICHKKVLRVSRRYARQGWPKKTFIIGGLMRL